MKMDPIQYKIALSRIVQYLEAQGYMVKLNSTRFSFIAEESLITCSTKAHGTYSMISSLLHEVGHTIQPSSQFNNMHKSIKRNKAIIIELEYTAWAYGWLIAKELDIDTPILEQEYLKSWLKYWTQYIELIQNDWSNAEINSLAEVYIEP